MINMLTSKDFWIGASVTLNILFGTFIFFNLIGGRYWD